MTATADTKPKAPRNCYWRGARLWGEIKVGGRRIRFPLGTDDPAIAEARISLERSLPPDQIGQRRPNDPPFVSVKAAKAAALMQEALARHQALIDGFIDRAGTEGVASTIDRLAGRIARIASGKIDRLRSANSVHEVIRQTVRHVLTDYLEKGATE